MDILSVEDKLEVDNLENLLTKGRPRAVLAGPEIHFVSGFAASFAN